MHFRRVGGGAFGVHVCGGHLAAAERLAIGQQPAALQALAVLLHLLLHAPVEVVLAHLGLEAGFDRLAGHFEFEGFRCHGD